MAVHTKRWNDARGLDDGFRLLICRYRPRGLRREQECWDGWCSALAPSKELHAARYGKHAPAIDFQTYERRFRAEMEFQSFWISAFADRVRKGETITLLCSSACTDEACCHRTIVKVLIEQAAAAQAPAARGVVKRSGR